MVAESVQLAPPQPGDLDGVRALIEEFVAATGSERASALLDGWEATTAKLRKVVPRPAAG